MHPFSAQRKGRGLPLRRCTLPCAQREAAAAAGVAAVAKAEAGAAASAAADPRALAAAATVWLAFEGIPPPDEI